MVNCCTVRGTYRSDKVILYWRSRKSQKFSLSGNTFW